MILCCGEALIDMIPEPTLDRRDGFVPHTGGAVFNTAIALARLNVPTGMLTGLSTDMFGDLLHKDLHVSKVDTSHVIFSDRPTTLAFVSLKDGQAQYSFYDENSAGRMIKPKDLPTIESEVSALFFGGISLACDPCADAYADLAINNSTFNVIMVDPNIRQSFIQNEIKYRQRLDAVLACADICKVSDEDLDWICQSTETLDQKAKRMLDLGPNIVIVTKGAEGSTAFLKSGETIDVPSRPATVVDTVGAGDTFNAGFLASLANQGVLTKQALSAPGFECLTQALDFGAATAAITVSRKGANPPTLAEVLQNVGS